MTVYGGEYHRLQVSAHKKARKAMRDGKIPTPGGLPCFNCGKVADRYDHRDYRKPLEVRPVCASCNGTLPPAEPVDLLRGENYRTHNNYRKGWGEGDGGFDEMTCHCAIPEDYYEGSGWRPHDEDVDRAFRELRPIEWAKRSETFKEKERKKVRWYEALNYNSTRTHRLREKKERGIPDAVRLITI